MGTPDLSGQRVLVLGAETEVGAAIGSAAAEAGGAVALVAATNDPEAAFRVQRLARRLSAGGRKVISQAIDATNEMAVRVMVRQVSKELAGLNAAVACVVGETHQQLEQPLGRLAFIRWANKEIGRSGGGVIVIVLQGWLGHPLEPQIGPTVGIVLIAPDDKAPDQVALEAVGAIAAA